MYTFGAEDYGSILRYCFCVVCVFGCVCTSVSWCLWMGGEVLCAEWASMDLSAVVEEHRCELNEHPWVSVSQHMYLCAGEEL